LCCVIVAGSELGNGVLNNIFFVPLGRRSGRRPPPGLRGRGRSYPAPWWTPARRRWRFAWFPFLETPRRPLTCIKSCHGGCVKSFFNPFQRVPNSRGRVAGSEASQGRRGHRRFHTSPGWRWSRRGRLELAAARQRGIIETARGASRGRENR
jgi:hypothetical protein